MKLVRLLHGWAGISLGLLLTLVCTTGTLCAYRHDLNQWWHASIPQRSQPPNYGRLAAAVQRDYGDATRVSYVGAPAYTGNVIEVWARQKTETGGQRSFLAYYDPLDLELLSDTKGSTFSAVLAWLANGHVSLWAGSSGHLVVGVLGFLGLAFVATGTYLWLPRLKVRRPLQLRWRASRRVRHGDLHHVGGLLAAVPLLLVSFSGVLLVFPQSLSLTTAALGGETSVDQAREPVSGTPKPIGQLIQAAESAVRGGKVAWIPGLPLTGEEPLVLTLTYDGNPDPYKGGVLVTLDPTSGQILQLIDPRHGPAAVWMERSHFGLHTGEVFGEGGRALFAVAGLLPLLLAWSGWVIWLRRRQS
ncbi:MAG: PepSY-associated TM helix domain-containing protein [Pseudomonadota bacterium]